MAETNPILYGDLIKPDSSIEDLIKQLEELKRVYGEMLDLTSKQAIKLTASLKQVSGATEQGRKASVDASKEADKLAKAQEALAYAESETAQEIARLKALTAEQNAINKANAKQAKLAADSYDYLSAQYTKNKIILNKMSEAERENTKHGKELVAETKRIYEQMNNLQKATGKYTLQVGNYTIAGDRMAEVLKKGKEELKQMSLAGKENTAEFRALAEQLAHFRDTSSDVDTMINKMASDTSNLDAVLQAAAVGTGGFAAVTGAMTLFGAESKDVEEAQKQLQAAIALVNGVTAIQNALQKQSALVTKLKAIQDKILGVVTKQNTATTAANTAAITAQTTATKAATTATTGFSKALNVLKSNPIILILSALAAAIGAVVVAVKVHRAEQRKLYEQQLKALELTEAQRKAQMQVHETAISNIQQQIKVAQAQGKSEEEILKLREQEFAERSQMAVRSTAWNKKEIDALEENKRKLAENNATLKAADADQIKLKKYKREEIEAENALLERQIEIAEEQISVNNDLEAEYYQLAEERRQLAIATAQADEDSLRQLQDARNNLIKNQFARERATTKANYDRQIADLKARLQNELNLTETQRKNINALIIELGKTRAVELAKIDKQEQAAELATARETENLRLAIMDDGQAKEQEQLRVNYERQTADLHTKLETDSNLTVNQRAELNAQLLLLQQQYLKNVEQLNDKARTNELNAELKAIELRRAARMPSGANGADAVADTMREIEIRRELELKANKELAVDLRQDEAAINAKYDLQRLQTEDKLRKEAAENALTIQQNLAKSEIDIMQTSEKKKTELRLQLERERLQKILELDQEANIKMSEEERKTIENQIAKIDADIKKNRVPTNLYEVLGLDLTDEQMEGFNTSLDYAKQALTSFYDYKMKLAEQSLDMANREVEAAQNVLNSEREARAAGYANNVAMAEKELAAAKQQQRKALKQQQETQKAQQKIQAVEQAVNMVTATAKIFGSMPIYLAIPAIALMWGAFIASKVKAKQLTSEQYGEGTVELLQGGSHQSHNDVDLGTKPDGTRRRAEGGEFFAVINKRSSRKYRKQIPEIINALNSDTFAEKYARAYDGANSTNIFTFNGSSELKTIAKDISEMNERQRTTVVYTADGWIEKKGNITRIIHK